MTNNFDIYRSQQDESMEFDAQNKVTCEETKSTEQPKEWVIGELYENKDGDVLEFLGFNRHRKDIYPYVFINVESGFIVHHIKGEIIKNHAPKPVEHTIEYWINVYGSSRNGATAWQSKYAADANNDECIHRRIACLHIKRKFVEGEGL